MYSMNNEEKSVTAERFIRTSKNKYMNIYKYIYKYMTSISKNLYIDRLDGIVNKYNNTYHRTIKMKPVEVKPSIYNDFNEKIIRKVLNLKLVVILEYQNIKIFLQKVAFQIYLKKFLWLQKLKILYRGPWTYVISDLNGEEIVLIFHKKELRKTNRKEFREIKRKCDKRHVH